MDVLVEFGFKVHRGLMAESAVEPHPVVKDFDPVEDGRASLGPRGANGIA
jgi:hypothetical protein